MVSKKKVKKFLLFLIGKNRHGIGKKGGYYLIGDGAEILPLEKDRKCPAAYVVKYEPPTKFQFNPTFDLERDVV